MASGKISKKITGREYYISWSSVANVENNTSTITCEHYLKNDNSYSLRVGGGTISSCSVGTDYKEYTSPAIYTDGGQTHHLGTTTHTVAHNSDGSKSVSIQGSYAISATLSGTWYATLDASGTAVLDKIPRQATLDSAPNFEDIDNPKITYTNEAGNSVDSLQACIADANGETVYVSYRNISKTGSSYTFNLTDAERNALRNAIPNDNSMTVKFYVKCVIGSKIYYSSLAKTFTIVNANPTFNPTITDINTETTALTGDSSKLIRYYSDVNITTGASAVKGAKLVSQKVMNGGKSITTASGSITDVESGTFTFTATDSRGNTTTQKIEKNIVNYIKLTLNISNKTPDASGNFTFTVNGNYFDGSFGVKSNSLTVKYRYCVKGDEDNFSEWADMNISPGYGTYSATAELSGLDYQTTYTFQARAYDLLETVDRERAIKATPVFDWSEDDFNFNVPVSINGNFIVDFITEQGTVDGWEYRRWNSGVVEAWRGTTISVATNTAYGSGYYNGSVLSEYIPSGMFNNIPIISASATPSNAQIYNINIASANKTSISYYISSTQSNASANMYINFYLKGFTGG